MAVDPEDAGWVKGLLWPNENIVMTVRERRIGPGGSLTVPTSVVVTDKRLIIVNKATLGFRRDYEVIPYKQINSVRFEKGLISSSVFLRVTGYDRDQGLLKNGKEEGEIEGLNNTDAKELTDYLNKVMQQEQDPMLGQQSDGSLGAYRFCTKCGAKNTEKAKFCKKCGAKLE